MRSRAMSIVFRQPESIYAPGREYTAPSAQPRDGYRANHGHARGVHNPLNMACEATNPCACT